MIASDSSITQSCGTLIKFVPLASTYTHAEARCEQCGVSPNRFVEFATIHEKRGRRDWCNRHAMFSFFDSQIHFMGAVVEFALASMNLPYDKKAWVGECACAQD